MAFFDRLNRFATQFGELIADDIGARVELGAAFLERGDYDAAIRELSQATARRRDHARALYLLGLAHLRRGGPADAEEAQANLLAALAVREGLAEAHVALGVLKQRQGALAEAEEYYREALPLIGDPAARAEIERDLGTVYLALGRLDKAVRELRKAAAALPEDAEVQGLLGQALIQGARKRGEPQGGPTYEAARLCLLRAARAEPPSPRVLAALGRLLLDAGQHADAEQAFRRALEVDADADTRPSTTAGTEALLGLGRLRLEQGDVAAAYEQALRAASRPAAPEERVPSSEVHALLARCHARSGAPERALAAYEEALKALTPVEEAQRLPLMQEMLQLCLRQGLPEQAAALGARPPLSETAAGLAAQSLRADLPIDEGEALVKRALGLGESVDVRLCQARLLRRRDQLPAAAAALRRAAALDPGDPRPREELSRLYRQQAQGLPRELYGLLTLAQRHFATVPELFSLLPEASQLLSALDQPLLLTVMGEFNSGKSTFVNALLGEEVAPMGITPTTATINILKYGRERGGRVVYRNDSIREVPWQEVPALLRAVDEEEARRIRFVEVLYPLPALQQVNVVDTPGLNSILPEHEATAREFIAQADAVVWLFTVDQAGKASEREALSAIQAQGKEVLAVINKIDRLALLDRPQEPGGEDAALSAILAHLQDPQEGLGGLLAAVVPFSGRDALLGHKQGDEERVRRANLPVLMETLKERFFARSQAIKLGAARGRLAALLTRARGQVEALLREGRKEDLLHKKSLLRADALLAVRDFVPAERRRLIAAADEVHRGAARETLDFVRPRSWPFGDNRAAPADRDFLLGLLDENLSTMLAGSRARVLAELKEPDAAARRLLDEQVYGHYRAFARGYLRGGKVDDFFVRVLPKLDLSEAAIGRALERDGPTAIDILEAELLTPLRAFLEQHFRALEARLQQDIDAEEMRRFDLEERVLYPVEALLGAL